MSAPGCETSLVVAAEMVIAAEVEEGSASGELLVVIVAEVEQRVVEAVTELQTSGLQGADGTVQATVAPEAGEERENAVVL